MPCRTTLRIILLPKLPLTVLQVINPQLLLIIQTGIIITAISQTGINYDLGGLDDLNQDNQDARAAIKSAYKTWVQDTGADGVRVDAARSIPKDFLAEFEKSLGVPTFGEVFVGDVDYVSDFQKYEWGVLDFPLFFQAREVFAHDADFTTVKKIFDQDNKYKDPNRLVTFIDNH